MERGYKKAKMKHTIKEITKIVLRDKKTGKVVLEAKPTTQPLHMEITNKN